MDGVEATVRMLVENPAAGRARLFRPLLLQGVRSWPVKGFGVYLLFHRVAGDSLEVVRLIHGARHIPTLLEEE